MSKIETDPRQETNEKASVPPIDDPDQLAALWPADDDPDALMNFVLSERQAES